MRRRLGERLRPVEVILELGCLGIGVLPVEHFRRNGGLGAIDDAQFFASDGVVADALGEDVAGAGERLLRVLYFALGVLAVVERELLADVSLRGGKGISRGILSPEQFGEWFEAFLLRDGGAGAL